MENNHLVLFLLLIGLCLNLTNSIYFPGRQNRPWMNRKLCDSGQFTCSNNQCISQNEVCNGIANCADQSDESSYQCSRYQCSFEEFQCNYGACIHKSKVCDGYSDCVDMSDERSCSGQNIATTCPSGQFKCKSSNQCIYDTNVCDGQINCMDGSDETQELCDASRCSGYRCKNGACILTSKVCDNFPDCTDRSDEDPSICRRNKVSSSAVIPNSSSKCPPPDQPRNGNWKLHSSACSSSGRTIFNSGYYQNCDPDPRVQEYLPGTQLVFECNPGFGLTDSANVFCNLQGRWSGIPKCVAIHCNPISLASVNTRCILPVANRALNCNKPMPHGTKALLTCKSSYEKDISDANGSSEITCQENGHWYPQPMDCKPICGINNSHKSSSIYPFIVNGTIANLPEFPWHASLHAADEKVPEKINFICGATIIQPNLLVTAAHCVYDEINKAPKDPKKLYVISGNKYQDYYHQENNRNPYVARSRVKKIFIECNYNGFLDNYANDIAIVEIENTFMLSQTLSPACLDSANLYNEDIFQFGNLGKVAGFGRTSSGATSAILQSLSVPYASVRNCMEGNPSKAKFITEDKFCAGYNNGSSVCDGDSGSGLVFQHKGIWYLEGVVSTGVISKEENNVHCDSYSFSLYTKVAYHMSWIRDVIVSLTDKKTTVCTTVR